MSWMMQTPEVTSAKLFRGPGASTLITAASSWEGVAAELRSAAQTYQAVLSGLANWDWLGQASAAMTAAATTFIEWLTTTAAQVQRTAAQARVAALAFEQALATAVSPALITANRQLVRTLLATNFFGQNTPLIEAAQADYAEYWAKDAGAMSDYAAASTAATRLPPFTTPSQNTNPAGQANQTAAATSAAANSPVQALSQLLTQLSSALQQLPGIIFSGILPEDFTVLDEILLTNTAISSTEALFKIVSNTVGVSDTFGLVAPLAEAAIPAAAQTLGGELAPVLASVNRALSTTSGLGGGAVLASTGQAGVLKQMSVPPSWAVPASHSSVGALAGTPMTDLPEEIETAMPGMPGIPGLQFAGNGRGFGPRYGAPVSVVPRPPAGG